MNAHATPSTPLMSDHVLTVLEFPKVRAQIRELAATSLGKERVDMLRPLSERQAAEAELAAVDECLQYLHRQGPLPFGGICDIRPAVRKAALRSTLSGEELVAIASFIHGARRIRQALLAAAASFALPRLMATAERLADVRDAEQEIRRHLDDEGQVLDGASPELRRIRTQKRETEARVRQVLDGMLRTHQRYLQDPVVALRGSSLCLPVRVEFKNMVPGVVHDYSASGATVYIEPQAVVELNLRIRELEVLEAREVERILARISAVVGDAAPQLLTNADVLAEIDSWMARAEYAVRAGASRPRLADDGVFDLRRARHPLLPREQAVPIDLRLGDAYQMVVITGPNTGGKTVTLKTIGLLTLMAMAGCFIPAGEGSSIGFCDQVFVDIGDEQSIEQSLSTFSSHMRHIVDMLAHVTQNSLVLLDELGAGTDPTEGAALAMAILDHLRQVGCRVVATTHYPELKAYAFRTPGAVNASMEFDVETLRPTYRLLVGVPGRSNAIAIAERLGLPAAILAQARAWLDRRDVAVEDILAQMERARQEMEAARERAVAARAEAEALRAQWEEARARLEEETRRVRAQAAAQAQETVARAQAEADRIIRALRQMHAQAVKDHELVALRKALADALPEEPAKTGRGRQPASVSPGDVVRVLSLGQKGEVVDVAGDGQALVVQLGALRMKVDATDVEVLQKQPPAAPASPGVRRGLPRTVPLEIDVRGETVDEALPRVDKYLDDAVVAGLKRVAIIHGKGTGALRDGVRRFLNRHPHVASWTPGGPGEGGDGVTVVELE